MAQMHHVWIRWRSSKAELKAEKIVACYPSLHGGVVGYFPLFVCETLDLGFDGRDDPIVVLKERSPRALFAFEGRGEGPA